MESRMFKRLSVCFFWLVLLVGPAPAYPYSDKIYKSLGTFSKILEIVDRHYVEQPDEKKLMTGAIKGLLLTLDPHTVYFPAEVYKDFKSDTQGRFGGIGIEVTIKDGLVTVVSPVDGSPAQKAGIVSGDKILMINGKITKGMDLTDAVHMMRGNIGKKIVLSVWHAGMKQARQVTLERQLIKVASVVSENLGDGYGYFKITSFQEGTSRSLKKALNGLKRASGGKIKGIVLDLRDDPGGLLTEAIRVCDFFLDGGVIVSTKGRDKVQEVKKAKGPGTFPNFPMVVMINGGSASASEIVAGALQDQGRAKLLGTRSYGKGSVQTVINLDDGDAIKITIARYYTPKNRMIDGKGIDPDVWLGKKEFKKSLQAQSKEKEPKMTVEAFKEYQKNEALAYLKKIR
jgi:carboxyl-terminal processing protease